MTPEKEAEVRARVRAIINRHRPKPRPKVVTSGGQVIRDAEVSVSGDDPNAARGVAQVVTVRRPDYVTVDMAAYERQWEAKQAARIADRAHRKAIDPYSLGLYGPIDDDEG